MPEALDAYFGHFDPARRSGMFKVGGRSHIGSIDHGNGKILVDRMRTPVVRVAVLDDLTNLRVEVPDRGGDLDRDQTV